MLKSVIMNFVLVILILIGIVIFGYLRSPQIEIKDYGTFSNFNLPIYQKTEEFQHMESFSSDFLHEKPAIMMFFASWCKSCKTRLSKLVQLRKKLLAETIECIKNKERESGQKISNNSQEFDLCNKNNVKIIGVAIGDSKIDLDNMFKEYENPFDIIVFDDINIGARDFNVMFIPQFIGTKKGHILMKTKNNPEEDDLNHLENF